MRNAKRPNPRPRIRVTEGLVYMAGQMVPSKGGGGSAIEAITPPNQYSQAVWAELVRQGKLKHAGHGTYELVTT